MMVTKCLLLLGITLVALAGVTSSYRIFALTGTTFDIWENGKWNNISNGGSSRLQVSRDNNLVGYLDLGTYKYAPFPDAYNVTSKKFISTDAFQNTFAFNGTYFKRW